MGDKDKAREALRAAAEALGVNEVEFISKLAVVTALIEPHRQGKLTGLPHDKDWSLIHAASAELRQANQRLIRAKVLW